VTGEVAYSGLAGNFVREVGARLEPGKSAVCASVWEDWTVPIDVAVAPFSGDVFRQATDDVAVAQLRSEMQALKDERAHVDAEIARSAGEAKLKLQVKADELRLRQDAQRDRLRQRANELQKSWEAKLARIEQKASGARAEARARHEQHREKLARFAADQNASLQTLFI
jgi:hypothetical protein